MLLELFVVYMDMHCLKMERLYEHFGNESHIYEEVGA